MTRNRWQSALTLTVLVATVVAGCVFSERNTMLELMNLTGSPVRISLNGSILLERLEPGARNHVSPDGCNDDVVLVATRAGDGHEVARFTFYTCAMSWEIADPEESPPAWTAFTVSNDTEDVAYLTFVATSTGSPLSLGSAMPKTPERVALPTQDCTSGVLIASSQERGGEFARLEPTAGASVCHDWRLPAPSSPPSPTVAASPR